MLWKSVREEWRLLQQQLLPGFWNDILNSDILLGSNVYVCAIIHNKGLTCSMCLTIKHKHKHKTVWRLFLSYTKVKLSVAEGLIMDIHKATTNAGFWTIWRDDPPHLCCATVEGSLHHLTFLPLDNEMQLLKHNKSSYYDLLTVLL